jgi:hypothetical protein
MEPQPPKGFMPYERMHHIWVKMGAVPQEHMRIDPPADMPTARPVLVGVEWRWQVEEETK